MPEEEIFEIIESLLDLVMKRDENITCLLTQIEELEAEIGELKGTTESGNVNDKDDETEIKYPDRRPEIREGIFLVDDCPIMQRMLKDLVKRNGLTVVGEAQDGIDALRMFMTIKPQVAIVDINMPRMNELDLLKKIREIDPDIKVIIISGSIDKTTVLKALSYGANDFLVKPIKPYRMINALNGLAN